MDIKNLNEKFSNAKRIKDTQVKLNNIISRNPEIDATDLDGEVVMMNMEKGQYFMMNEVGSRIWEIIEEPMKISELIDALLGEFEVERDECENTVMEFLNDLSYGDLIKVS
ncbi:MAG: lasso peptide biosynthesis PqqD family chaperone [Clostridium sp.]|uniref:lasso peptide biosynthesis PqqD family chaperone n=1 Tax=Clostridium culturomicium TaxID=1499683 RepID=UPI00059131F0|nr:lasso peptide biosynthesis PqqD family chaperone [Clostridium culturomicium]MDU4892509.1 lasso peptide biosynthesis PqqD family chaperone [Clostridium sp.]MDU7084678.1 lasso peptide biosynthesis PqqD family chaperone [Clostridium sp.]